MDLYATAHLVRNNTNTAEDAERKVTEIRKARTLSNKPADIAFLKEFIVEHLAYWMAVGKNDHF